jgi:hypothetical protein
MGAVKTAAPVRSATVEAIVKRADGSMEYLGIVSYYHQRIACRFLFWLETKVRAFRNTLEKRVG